MGNSKKNFMKRGKKKKKLLNAILKHHMEGPYAFPYEIFAFIYIVTNPCNAQDSYCVWKFKQLFVSFSLIVHWIPVSKIPIIDMKH